ncbi:MAG: M1 family metallopeptidase [Chitinophagaceae bacterium]|nr:M1 family metallopeptidase [Chitinophagaceae bacterium]
MKKISTLCLSLIIIFFAQAQNFTRADTLRGSDGEGRNWWDIVHYDLHVKFNIEDSTISGYNVIRFNYENINGKYFQIDLQEPLVIDSVILDLGLRIMRRPDLPSDRWPVVSQRRKLRLVQEGNAWFAMMEGSTPEPKRRIVVKPEDTTGFVPNITVYYHGKPRIARQPPWDGGVIWKKDNNGNPWVTVACQGLGASVWYPCKDYQGDEPDKGATMHFTAPDSLMIVSNGRMKDSVNNGDGTHTISWEVVNPINNYNISPYIGKYTHFGEVYDGEEGPLTMDYWVLDYNVEKAKSQFADAPRMMKAFEYWFGPYAFYADGYKLVEAPHLGMEHQSAVAYGNRFANGYLGRDLSGSGWGMKWDFIIIHESGHEWFGNNITTKDIADMWVHEGFTNYSEALFTEYYYGKEAGSDYVVGIRKNIANRKPIVGFYGVNNEGSGDMYYKGANMIHTIRQIIDNDEKFRAILRGLNQEFRRQTVTGKQVQDYINRESGMDFTAVFKQYLKTIDIPVLEYKNENGKLVYRWANVVEGFAMPVKVINDSGAPVWLYPTSEFSVAPKVLSTIKVDRNFYVFTKELTD